MHEFQVPAPERQRLEALVPPLRTLLLAEGETHPPLALPASFPVEAMAFGPLPPRERRAEAPRPGPAPA